MPASKLTVLLGETLGPDGSVGPHVYVDFVTPLHDSCDDVEPNGRSIASESRGGRRREALALSILETLAPSYVMRSKVLSALLL
jgi:hypothetical protein